MSEMPAPRKKTVQPRRAAASEEATRLREAFVRYLASERQLSDHTAAAYGRDVRRFYQWLGGRRVPNLSVADLADYPAWLVDRGLAPASVARHVASLKAFFRYLQLEGVLNENQAALLASRKLWRKAPTVLSPGKVDRSATR